MTVPSMGDPAGFNLQWWEGVLGSLTGGASGISGLVNLTQAAVQAAKQAEIEGNAVLTNILTMVFDGLRSGIPLALSIIEAIVVNLFGLIPGFASVADALAAIEEVPGVAAIVTAITGVPGDLADIATFLGGKWTDLSSVVAAIAALIAAAGGTAIEDVAALINNILQFITQWVAALSITGVSTPTNFVELLRGLIPAAIPQFNGTWAPTNVSGFTDNLNGTIGFAVGEAQSDVAQLIQQADGTIITASQVVQHVANGAAQAGAAVGQAVAAGQAVADGIVQAAAADATLVAQAAGTAQANLATLFNNFAIHLGFGALPGQGGTNIALSGTAAAITSAQAQANAVAAALNTSGSVGGTDVTVDFSTLANAPTLAGITTPGAGPIGITSGEMAWQGTATGDDVEGFPTPTVSDYQVIEVTLGSLNDLIAGNVRVNIQGRKNASVDTKVMVSVYHVSARYVATLYVYVNGTFYTLYDATLPALSSGGVFKLILGDKAAGNPYIMELLYNGAVVLGPYSDSGHVSQIGSGNRSVAVEESTAAAGNPSNTPPNIRKIRYYDNAPSTGNTPFSGLPASNPSIPGGLYFCSDTGLVLRDNGGGWDRVQGGPLTAFTAPPASFTNTTTLGTATIAASLDGRLIAAPSSGGTALRAEYSPLPSASPYVLTAYLDPTLTNLAPPAGASCFAGILVTDGTKFMSLGGGNANGFGVGVWVANWSSQSALSGTDIFLQIGTNIETMPHWFRIRDDGANVYFEYSFNGTEWGSAYTAARTSFLTATSYGWGVNNQGTGRAAGCRLRSMTIA